MPSWGFPGAADPGGLSSTLQPQTFPLVFDTQALQQVTAATIIPRLPCLCVGLGSPVQRIDHWFCIQSICLKFSA